jgi:hypothetical protein
MNGAQYHKSHLAIILATVPIRMGVHAEVVGELWEAIEEALNEWAYKEQSDERQIRVLQETLREMRATLGGKPPERVCSVCGLPESECVWASWL